MTCSVCLVYYGPYCLPPTSVRQAGNNKQDKQSINWKEGAKYAAKKFLPPPSKMCGVTFHLVTSIHPIVSIVLFGSGTGPIQVFWLTWLHYVAVYHGKEQRKGIGTGQELVFVQVSEWAHWWVVCIVWDQRIVPPTYSSFWLQNTFLCSYKGPSQRVSLLFVLLEPFLVLRQTQ